MWAVQFHPEVRHTQSGGYPSQLRARNLRRKTNLDAQHFIDATVAGVRQQWAMARHLRTVRPGWTRPWLRPWWMRLRRTGHFAADLRLCQQRFLRKNEFEKVQLVYATTWACDWWPSMPPNASSQNLPVWTDPETKRKIIGNDLSRSSMKKPTASRKWKAT